jgi:DNA-directed RNA polymerase specialized sigma subunit
MKTNLENLLREYYLAGKSYADIARSYGFSRQYVQQLCSKKTPEIMEAKSKFYSEFMSIKDSMPVNKRIKIARIMQGKTQTELAEEVGIKQSYLCNLENRESNSYHYKTIQDTLCI